MEAINQLELEHNDKRNAGITSLVSLIVIYLLLQFTYLYHNDPPLEKAKPQKPIPVEQFIEAPIINNNGGGGGGGGGTPTSDPVDPTPKAQTENVVTNSHGKVSVNNGGNANHTTAKNSTNEATSTKKSNNPFGDGGNGPGEGGGVGKGKGLGFGPDSGDGKGPGNGPNEGGGSGKDRVRIKNPNIDNIASDANHSFTFILRIDAEGNVLSAQNTSNTTTTDQSLIDQVKSITIRQAKYKKKPGAGVEQAYITLKLFAR